MRQNNIKTGLYPTRAPVIALSGESGHS